MYKKSLILNTPPETRSFLSGYKGLIEIPELTAGSMVQYDQINSDDIKTGIKRYGWFNSFNVLNQSDQDLTVLLDFENSKSYIIPAGNSMSVSDVMFERVQLENNDSSTISASLCKLYCIYERPQVRELI